MKDPKFNLLDEPWILADNLEGVTVCLSLKEVLEQSHLLRALSGEVPTQDVAMLRLLLAVLHSVFARYDSNGVPLPKEYDVLSQWNQLWNRGSFPMSVIEPYLAKYYDRFWFIHDEYPFFQIPTTGKGTYYSASKLIGDIAESSNKSRLFQARVGSAKIELLYAEAARWLLHLNAFDDTSAKPTRGHDEKLPSVGAGWVGRLGVVYAEGSNLFETLMLNLVLVDAKGMWWEVGGAFWEQESIRTGERTEIRTPESQAALLTLQSRRIALDYNGDAVSGYWLLGGDFFPREDAFAEQMTLWRQTADSKDHHQPKRHDTSKQFWRDFAALMARAEDSRKPGIVDWLAILVDTEAIDAKNVRMRATAVQYGDKDFFVTDIWEDSIAVNAGLMSPLSSEWINRIVMELDITEKVAYQLGLLASNISLAAGDKQSASAKRKVVMEEAYFRLDLPFRTWLEEIEPTDENMEEKCKHWRTIVRSLILRLGEEVVSDGGTKAFVGRKVKDKQREQLITSARAYSMFRGAVNKLLLK